MLCVALIGWLALTGAGPPQDTHVNSNATAQIQTTPATAIKHPPKSGADAESCDQPSDDRDPNLCAAVRSAVAAEKQADRARYGNLISAVIAPFSFFGILIAAYALRQTNKSLRLAHKDRVAATRRAIGNAKDTNEALRHAESSAKAGADQVKIAQDSAKKQLSAYVGIESVRIAGRLGFDGKAVVIIRNYGQTPAEDVRFKCFTQIMPYTSGMPIPVGEYGNFVAGRILPHAAMQIYIPIALEDFIIDNMRQKVTMLVLMINYGYSSLFGQSDWINAPFALYGDLIKEGRMEHAWDGWSG